MKNKWSQSLLFVSLVGLCVAARLLPHAPNCTPVVAAALLAGIAIEHRLVALLVPVLAMALGDWFIGTYDLRIMATVYAASILPLFFRRAVGGLSFPRIGTCSLACSLIFFVTSNFAVWCWSGMYPATGAGLLRCYASALPFLQYSLAGDLFWSGLLFGAYRLAVSTTSVSAAPRSTIAPRSAVADTAALASA